MEESLGGYKARTVALERPANNGSKWIPFNWWERCRTTRRENAEGAATISFVSKVKLGTGAWRLQSHLCRAAVAFGEDTTAALLMNLLR